ncbi:glutamate-rich 6-like [Brachionus plicatilis]|uniref:Glutamate-rich 6-like n=1 Tax=Brachionus plicatilis TaxID=10195 RepID=A0A3M7T6K2_BRAPC|nr:glutamate-rich 6-like [Brachionus plicatilis]
MSDYNESSDAYSILNDKEKGRQSRPRIFSNFRKESTSTNASVKSVKSEAGNQNSVETQTDWSWIQDMELIKRIRSEGAEIFEEIVNDLAQSSDSEQEDEPVSAPTPKPTPIVESIGPPKILQFNPEIKKNEIPVSVPSPSVSVDSDPVENLGQFMKDFNVHLKGGEYCEFCGEITQPWPTIQQQEKSNPELLHCCNDYREFVEALIQYQIEKERVNKLHSMDYENQKNTIKNAKARKLAEERAELRNMQRMVEKHKRLERIENLRQEKQQLQQQLQAKQINKANEQKNLESENFEKMSNNEHNETNLNKKTPRNRKTDTKHSPISIDQISNTIDTPVQSHHNLFNQNRSINYQLSNLRYLHEGWTVRPSTPIDEELDSLDEEEFNLVAREVVDSVEEKNFDKPMIIRKYKNEKNFLIIFPDGTGNIYYPSGRIALSITEASPGLNLLSAFSDDETNPILIASFDPYGNACANFLNGKVRMILSSLGGLEMDADGNRKKRWLWHDQTEHVHAPPFQPLIFSINNNISIRVVNQEKINIHFYAENQICKFKLIHSEISYGVKLPKIPSAKDNSKMDYLAYNKYRQEPRGNKSKQKSSKFITVP